MKYSLLLPPANKASQGGASRRLFKTRAGVGNDTAVSTFMEHVGRMTDSLRNTVAIDLGSRRDVSRSQCMGMLRQHIQHNIWQVGIVLAGLTPGWDKVLPPKDGHPARLSCQQSAVLDLLLVAGKQVLGVDTT